MFNNLIVLGSVKVDINAGPALMRSLSDEEDEVSLSEQELNLVDRPVACENFHIAEELADAVGTAGLMRTQ